MILSSGYFGCVRLYRSVYFSGRYGSGKTALAVATARYFQRRGYKFISNIPVWDSRRLFRRDEDIKKSVILLDEAAEVLDAYDSKSKKLLEAFRYLRHNDVIVLLPCVDLVQKRMRKMVVRRIFDASPILFGIWPIWIYGFWVEGIDKPLGHLIWIPDPEDFWYESEHSGTNLSTNQILDHLLARQAARRQLAEEAVWV